MNQGLGEGGGLRDLSGSTTKKTLFLCASSLIATAIKNKKDHPDCKRLLKIIVLGKTHTKNIYFFVVGPLRGRRKTLRNLYFFFH